MLSGAALLTSFTQEGSIWVAQSQVTEQSSYNGECASGSPVCMYPEDLFFNSVPKTRVATEAQVGPGTWYLDYSSGDVYMGDNPSGYVVELSELPAAFSGSATGVVIQGLIIEKYAAQASSGAVQGINGTNWTVTSVEARWNHGMGIRTGNGMVISDCYAHNNGELGLGGGGTNVTVENSQISYNNYAGYSVSWEAGGAKFAYITNLNVQNNNSHDNAGPGFWCDLNSTNVTFNGNQTSNNVEAGILYEISYTATISNNVITNDANNPAGTSIWYGAGILISNSANINIYGNTVTNCMNGIGGILASRGDGPDGDPYLIQNLDVYSNTVTQTTGTAAGIVIASGFDNSVYTSWNNHFTSSNTFVLATPATYDYFFWMNEAWTLATWNEYADEH